jgi:MerR family transcriptional regulator, copper efflux regulator
MESLDGYLRIREAARFLGVSPNTLRNWGREQKIVEFRHPVNNYRLFRRTDLEEILRQIIRPRKRTSKVGAGGEGVRKMAAT